MLVEDGAGYHMASFVCLQLFSSFMIYVSVIAGHWLPSGKGVRLGSCVLFRGDAEVLASIFQEVGISVSTDLLCQKWFGAAGGVYDS